MGYPLFDLAKVQLFFMQNLNWHKKIFVFFIAFNNLFFNIILLRQIISEWISPIFIAKHLQKRVVFFQFFCHRK